MPFSFQGPELADGTQSCARAEVLVPQDEDGLFSLCLCLWFEVGGSFSHR